MNRKVTVVGGAGNVGATVARAIADKELADVVIIDIAESKARGVALDIYEACPIEGSDTRAHRRRRRRGGLEGNGQLGRRRHHLGRAAQARDEPRRPAAGQLQDHAVGHRADREVLAELIIVPVANPLDAMCQAVYRLSGFPRERVIGMAGVLDSARMRTFIAMETGVSVENIHAFVLGGHGDTMVPLPRYSTIAGIPLPDYPGLTKETIDAIGVRTANGGAEITKLVGHERLVRARLRRGGDGRGDPQGQEEDPAVLGVPAG